VPSYFRGCAYYNPQTKSFASCQGRRDLSHYIPNYLGGWVSTGTAGVQSSASLVLGTAVAGQQITGVSIAGTDIVGGNTFTSASNGDQATLASNVCTAINANTDTTGYGCSVSGAMVTIQASVVGTAADGREVVVSGPAAGVATNSEGEITVQATTSGYQVNSISISRAAAPTSDGTTQELLAATVTSDGTLGNTAKAICEAINSGADTTNYEAKSGDAGDADFKYPSDGTRIGAACKSFATGFIKVRRIPTDTRDNGATINHTGPATGTQYSGTITVNSTSDATRITNITINGTSVIAAGSLPLVYPNGAGINSGSETTPIAADIASKINASGLATGCTASSSGNVVTIRNSATPATGLCSANNAIVVTATAVGATGKFRVSSTGSTNAANIGGVQTTATAVNLMGSQTWTNGTAVLTNATAMQTAINAFGSGFSAAAPVLTGSSYDITVTAPTGNSHNGKSFVFQDGASSPAGPGQQPQWTFPITGAAADNASISSITCGGTAVAPVMNTGNTSSNVNRVQNLTINTAAPTYGLNGKTGAGGASGYSYACSALTAPQYRCTVTGPAAAAACTNLSITAAASITLATTESTPVVGSSISPPAVGGAGGTKTWQFTFSDATNDVEDISSIRCGTTGTDPEMLNSTVTIGTASDPGYANTLRGNINTQSSAQNGWNGTSGCTSSGSTVSCSFERDNGAGNRCASVTIGKTGSLSPGSVTENWNGTRYSYSFDITNVTAASESIDQVTCNTGGNQESLSSAATRQSGDDTDDFAGRINDKSNNQNGWNGTSNCTRIASGHIRCGFQRDAGASEQCTGGVTPTGSGVTFSAVTESWNGTRYTYTFDITNAGSNGDSVSSVICTKTNTPQASMPASASTGTANSKLVWRLNEIKADLHGQSKNSGSGTFSWSCPTAATNASPSLTCTATSTDATCTSTSLRFVGTNNTGIYISGSGSQIDNSARNYNVTYNATSASSPTWTFDIRDATADSASISAINCGGTSILPTNAPNTGTVPASTVYQRINNMTGAVPPASGSLGPTNGYTLSCQPATATSTQPTCTLTGPAGVAACNTPTEGDFVITKDPSITIGTVTRTNAGTSAVTPTDGLVFTGGSPSTALSNVTPFSGGYAAQGTTVVDLAGVATGTPTLVKTAMTSGSGVSANTVPSNATGSPPDVLNMAGGQNPNLSTNHWSGVGIFNRTDIVSTNNSYARASGRSDCTGSTCTYNEEIQNYANWYTYYRTRTQLVKSATTIAFNQLDDKYRVGFDNICQPTGTTVKRGVAQFVDAGEVANQRTNWWAQLTGSNPNCATPLRAETAKIGRYYAGKLSGATDPLQYSCQQNFMMLVTDGYWNENEPAGTSITGGDIGNVDNNIATAPRPFYDGQQTATTTVGTGSGRGSTNSSARTLSDIAWYYYSTDIRSSANEVTVTTAAPHGLTAGQTYTISGVTPATYDGSKVVFVTSSTQFGFTASSNPGAYVSGGTVNNGTTTVAISAASYGAGRFGNATNPAGDDVSTNNVFVSTEDSNQAQHMNFYAMGLGIDGLLQYRSDYQTALSGDYYNIKTGAANWPAVANLDQTGVDDLWHATVNGHGKYFSARNVPGVISGLREALNKIGARVGSAAAAATSNLEPVAGDNFAYVASYATQDWVGDVQSRSIDVATGNVSADTGTQCGQSGTGCQWSAQAKLDAMPWATRRIFVKPTSGATGDPLRAFTWANLSAGETAYFNPSSLSQYAALSVSNPGDITADNLTKYLRGDRGMEQDGDTSHPQIWRRRAHVMGDIVNTQPIFMKAPTGNYSDPGYSAFKTSGTAASRRPVVFVAGQDGMLRAINADTAAVTVSAATVSPGEEMWAFIPSQVLSSLKLLADVNYGSTDASNANHHRYFIDGQITIADVNFGGSDADWHTILVAGQGSGGNSYFALDVTDPLNPTFLWEFTDSRLGYTYGNSVVTKLPNGEWAVLFSSGYNNTDGKGYLFAINPKTGAIKTGYPLDNNSGTGASPSNLGKIAVWATDPALNNTAEFVYAGDMNGDLWRFDLAPNTSGHTTTAVFKLAHLAIGATAQPITTKPELSKLSNGTRLVFVGTGKYLENSDLTNTDGQSLYAIKDTLGAQNLGNPGVQDTWTPQTDMQPLAPTSPMFIQRKLIDTKSDGSPVTITLNGATRQARRICTGPSATVNAVTDACANESSPTTLDWDLHGGWFVNLPDSGERINVDTKLVLGTLVFAGNVPIASDCTVGGTSWVTSLNYSTGLMVTGGSVAVGVKISDSLVVGLTVVRLSSGEYKAIATKSNYQQETLTVPVSATPPLTGSSVFRGRRGYWREFEAY
jgi:type IV pilus assembly protein PilY1